MSDEQVEQMLEAEGIATTEKSSVEALAAQYGWNSEGEKSAEEYIKVAMDKFPEQSKKIKQLFRAVDELKTHMTKTEKVAYEKAKAEIEQQRKQAISQGDVDSVERFDKAISELQPIVDTPAELHPAIVEFEEKNVQWLTGTSYEELKMQQWIEAHGAILGRKKLPPDEHMALLDEHVRKEFVSYFDQDDEDKEVSSPVSSSGRNVESRKEGKGKNKAVTFSDLSVEQKKVARDFEALGIMTVENYIKDLVKNGEFE